MMPSNNGKYRDRNSKCKVAATKGKSVEKSATTLALTAPEPQQNTGLRDLSGTPRKRIVSCGCKKLECLKLYCTCFQGGVYCNEDCACGDCKNREGEKARSEAILAVLRINKDAFRPNSMELRNLAPICLKKHRESPDEGFPGQCTGMDCRNYEDYRDNNVIDRNRARKRHKLVEGDPLILPAPASSIPVRLASKGQTGQAISVFAADPNMIPTVAMAKGTYNNSSETRGLMPNSRSTELEAAWLNEANKVGEVFQAVKTSGSDAVHSTGTTLLKSVQHDMQRLVKSVDSATENSAHQDGSGSIGVASRTVEKRVDIRKHIPDHNGNCTKLIEDASHQLAILAAQDLALLRELTKIIKEKTEALSRPGQKSKESP